MGNDMMSPAKTGSGQIMRIPTSHPQSNLIRVGVSMVALSDKHYLIESKALLVDVPGVKPCQGQVEMPSLKRAA